MRRQVSTIAEVLKAGLRATSVDRNAYLAELLNQRQDLGSDTATWLQEIREYAASLVQQQTLPTTSDEEWRFTDLSSLYQVSFQTAEEKLELAEADIASLTLAEASLRLVFVNGLYAPCLSSVANLPAGLSVSHLADISEHSRSYLGQQQGATEVFTALNTASFTDAAVVRLSSNQAVETPIHVLFISVPSAAPAIAQPRCLVVAAAGSALTLIEEYVAMGEGTYFTNAVTEIWVEENAQVNHSRIQREGSTAFHIGKTAISQARDSRYTCNAINLGAKLSRHNLQVFLTGEQTETTLNGLTLAADEQLSDTHSAIAFTQPYGTSRQLHKCIVDDRARAVFNGKVFVPKAAQLTNAGQLNRNLLLSAKARVDTKPQLEIVADNVKCSHGATVSQLDEEEVFYLQSRGLDRKSACDLLVEAFAIEMVEQLPLPSLRSKLSQLILAQVR